MDGIPGTLAMQMAIKQQNVALSMMKNTAQMQQQIANVLMEGANGISAATRGTTVNISA